MSRYIDADKLAMHLADYQYSIPYGCIDESAEDMGAYMAVGECLKAIDEQPTIDIVRCSECRYCKRKRGTFRGEPIISYRCEENNRDVENDDFCSWGERSGE